RSKFSGLFHWWFAAMILFIIVVGYGNRHPWYQLPLVPIAAVLAGAACAFVGSKISASRIAIILSILLASSFASLAYLYVRPLYRSPAAELRDAGLELKKTTATDALIIAADTGDPTIFYYAERKGWHFLEKDGIYDGKPSDSVQAIVDLERLRDRGNLRESFRGGASCSHAIFDPRRLGVGRTHRNVRRVYLGRACHSSAGNRRPVSLLARGISSFSRVCIWMGTAPGHANRRHG